MNLKFVKSSQKRKIIEQKRKRNRRKALKNRNNHKYE